MELLLQSVQLLSTGQDVSLGGGGGRGGRGETLGACKWATWVVFLTDHQYLDVGLVLPCVDQCLLHELNGSLRGRGEGRVNNVQQGTWDGGEQRVVVDNRGRASGCGLGVSAL